MPDAAIAYRLPDNVVARHPQIRQRRWRAGDVIPFKEIVDEAPENIEIEASLMGSTLIVRSANPGSMIRMARYADSLGGRSKPDAIEINKVLASRNPAKEELYEPPQAEENNDVA